MSVKGQGTSAAGIIYSPWQLNSCNSMSVKTVLDDSYNTNYYSLNSLSMILLFCKMFSMVIVDHIPMTFRTYTNSSCCLWLSQVYHLSNYNSILWPSKNGSLVRSICSLNLAPVAAQICMCHPQCHKAYMCFSLWILHTVQVSYNYTRNWTLLAEALSTI